MNEQAEKQEFALGDNQANDSPAIDWELFRENYKGERDVSN